MTTHDRDKVIAAAKEARCHHATEDDKGMRHWRCTNADMERLYAIAFEAGRQSVDTPVALAEAYRCGYEAVRVAGFSASIEACQAVGPKEYPNKLITDGYVDAIRARGDMK